MKAKEEAEDLAQEMAELRYQITGLLEEECKRRAYIEQASLQRISELEAQVLMFIFAIFLVSLIGNSLMVEKTQSCFVIKVQKEKRKSFAAVGHLHEV